MENQDLKFIKKYYGEDFMHLCRSLFPTLLETEGLLSKIIFKRFAPSRELYDAVKNNANKFADFIFGIAKKNKSQNAVTNKTPEQLMDEAGYILYPECKTYEDILKFKKFYAKGEELCTFNGSSDYSRLDTSRVWFAVKKDVDNIRREDFVSPQRQDEYGTSVISIQFTKAENSRLSIKNRYNHTVINPDATFENYLDNIIDGLTYAFINTYGINLALAYKDKSINLINALENFVMDKNGRFYHKTYSSILGTNFCENNIIVLSDGRAITFNPDKYILIEHFLLDLKEKKFIRLDYTSEDVIFAYSKGEISRKFKAEIKQRCFNDNFIKSIGEFSSVQVEVAEKGNKKITFLYDEDEKKVVLLLNKSNEIIGYYNSFIKKIGMCFLNDNLKLKKFIAPNLQFIDDCFLTMNETMEIFDVPKLKKIGHFCLRHNKVIKSLELPNLTYVGACFFQENQNLEELVLPNLAQMESQCFENCANITKLYLPSLKMKGEGCFFQMETSKQQFNS